MLKIRVSYTTEAELEGFMALVPPGATITASKAYAKGPHKQIHITLELPPGRNGTQHIA